MLLATGGFGRMFRVTSNAHTLTGDGVALAYRRGVPLQDMEFYQFHPTGIVGLGILLSEAARGEGGYLRNDSGERFMERYAPKLMELAPRDMVSRAIAMEIRDGRGIGGKDYVHLDLTPPGQGGHRRQAARHHRVRPGLPGRRAHHPAGAHPADRALRHGRHAHEHRRPGRHRQARHRPARAVRGRRVRLRQRPRRQPAGHQLARRPPRLRPARGSRHGPRRAGPPRLPDLASDAAEAVRDELEALRTRHDGENPDRIRQELADAMMDDCRRLPDR